MNKTQFLEKRKWAALMLALMLAVTAIPWSDLVVWADNGEVVSLTVDSGSEAAGISNICLEVPETGQILEGAVSGNVITDIPIGAKVSFCITPSEGKGLKSISGAQGLDFALQGENAYLVTIASLTGDTMITCTYEDIVTESDDGSGDEGDAGSEEEGSKPEDASQGGENGSGDGSQGEGKGNPEDEGQGEGSGSGDGSQGEGSQGEGSGSGDGSQGEGSGSGDGSQGTEGDEGEGDVSTQELPPVIAVSYQPEGHTSEKWSKEAIKVIFEPEAKAAGATIAKVYYAKGSEKPALDESMEISNAGNIFSKEFTDESENGEYICWAVDSAGRESAPCGFQVRIDKENPRVTGIYVSFPDGEEGAGEPLPKEEWEENVQKTTYGNYYKVDTVLTAAAADEIGGSGIKAITYHLVSKDGKTETKTVLASLDGKASYTVPAGFKGHVYIWAEDQAGNPSAEAQPDGIVIETAGQHDANAKVSIGEDGKLPDTWKDKEGHPVTDAQGNPLYAKKAEIPIMVEDSISGLEKVEWRIQIPGSEPEVHAITIASNGELMGEEEDIKGCETKTDSNMVTSLKKLLVIPNDSDGIQLSVALTCHAGYTKEAEATFSVDAVPPKVQVTYQDGEAANGIYSHAREALITVSDREFSMDTLKKGVEIIVKASEGNAAVDVSKLEWALAEGDAGLGEGLDTYQAKLPFVQDSAYSLLVTAKDRLGQEGSHGPDRFIVDTGKPDVSIESSVRGTTGKELNQPSLDKQEEDGVYWYNQDVKLSFQAQDTIAGLAHVEAGESPKEGVSGRFKRPEGKDKPVDEEYKPEDSDGEFGKHGKKEEQSFEAETEGDGVYQLSVKASDYAGNPRAEESKRIGVDTTDPTIEVSVGSQKWTKGDVKVSFMPEDNGSGIAHVYYAKGLTKTKDESKRQEAKAEDGMYAHVFTSQEDAGDYICWAEDYVGNESDAAPFSIKVDKTAPKVLGITFSAQGDTEETELKKQDIQKTPYGYFFQKNGTITVRVEDDASGVASISYALELAGEKKGAYQTPQLQSADGMVRYITFPIEEGFKGQIYVKAEDEAKNVCGEVQPDGIIIENEAQFQKNATIQIGVGDQLPDTEYQDAKGQKLYREDVPIAVSVENRFSGLQEIRWKVTAPYDGSGGEDETVKVSQSGVLAGDTAEWEKEEEDSLVVKMDKTFMVGNDSNDITVEVTIVDNVGHTKTCEKTFSIDKTEPAIHVSYDANPNTSQDEEYKEAYRQERIAFITVSDWNFDPDRAQITVTPSVAGLKTDMQKVKWEQVDDVIPEGQNEPVPTYQAQVPFAGDSAYHFQVHVMDLAGREDSYGPDMFVVDKEKPVLGEIGVIPADKRPQYIDQANAVQWYSDNVALSFKAQDKVSGLYRVDTSDGKDGKVTSTFQASSQKHIHQVYLPKDFAQDGINFGKRSETEEQSYQMYTSVEEKQNGVYQLFAETVDLAGNPASKQSPIIGIDRTAPVIKGIKFIPSDKNKPGKQEGMWNNTMGDDVEKRSYGYYFPVDTDVVVEASDQQAGVLSSGVKSIAYHMVDVDGTVTHPQPIAVDRNNKITFCVKANFKGQIYVYAIDNVGNEGNKVQTDGVIVEDGTAHKDHAGITVDFPDTDYKDAKGQKLYNEDVEIGIEVHDSYSGLSLVEVSVESEVTGEREKWNVEIPSKVANDSLEGWGIQSRDENLVTKMARTIRVGYNSNDIRLKVKITDRAGNVTEYRNGKGITFSIDKTKPDISVSYDRKESPSTSQSQNYQEFYNKERMATVTVKERNFDEEAATASIKQSFPKAEAVEVSEWEHLDVPGGKDDEEAHTCTISYPGSSAYNFSISVTDLAGNEKVRSRNDSPDVFMVDKRKPILEQSVVNPASDTVELEKSKDAEGVIWYNQNMNLSFTAQDKHSGLYHVKSNALAMGGLTGKFKEDINEKYKLSQYTVGNTSYGRRGQAESKAYTLTTDTKNQKSEKYQFTVVATDYAGNVSDLTSGVIGIDREKPRLTGIEFDFDPLNDGYADSEWTRATPEETDYGYYFRRAATVRIKATDVNENGSSGIQDIYYCLEDVSNTGKRMFEKGALQDVQSKEPYIIFQVPDGFKGQIYAYAVDKVGNEGDTKQPDGIIRENEAQKGEAHIEITAPTASYQDENGKPLYASDTTVHVVAEDIHSGIRQIDWSVESPEDSGSNQSGSLQVGNDGSLSSDGGWNVTQRDENLNTRMEKDIIVRNNSNDIKVRVRLTDRAGNVTEYNNGEGLEFSIDKTEPKIEVVYQQTNPANNRYYNTDRVAVVTVTERNFDEEATNRQIQISNTDGAIPAYGTWSHGGALGTDSATHSCTITYASDGDYTFTMTATDKAMNSTAYGNTDEFTIDQTKPEINVSYSTGGLSNQMYYKEECVATVTVKEHNFNNAGVVVSQTANLDGQAISAPSISGWSSNGDTHTATIRYDKDGDYTLNVGCQDMASNQAENYSGTKFVVDMTKPQIQIDQVENQTAYNGKVAPTVSFSDVNCDADSVKIVLKGCNHAPQDLTGSLSRDSHGGSVQLKDFEHTVDMDDVYTLTAEVTDKAGNSEEASKVFSVNRYGSNYVLEDDDTKELVENYYANQEKNLVIKEINVSSLKTESITCSRDGELKTLEKESDYEVQEGGTEYTSWKEYTYTIYKDNFEEEGSYVVTVLSTDGAANSMTNQAAKTEKYSKDVEFVIDKTAPTIVISGVENNSQYVEGEREVRIDTQDNVAIDSVRVYADGSDAPVATWTQEELAENDGIMKHMLKAASSWQDLQVVAVDKAGNPSKSDIIRYLLTSNVLVQFVNNCPLLYGTIALILAAAGLCWWLFIGKRKKKQGEEA